MIKPAIICLVLTTVMTSSVTAQMTITDPAPTYTVPLGTSLESYPYPYPVKYLPLEVAGQPVRMAYMDVSPTSASNGQTVVLLHGKNFDSGYWLSTIRSLTAAGYRVIVPDQIGFNKSSKPDIAYTFDGLAANTVKLLDTLKVNKVALIGHSTGGMLAVRFARTYPDRVTHLVLENPVGLEDYRFQIPPQTTERLVQDELEQTTEQYRTFVKRYFVTWKPEYESYVETRSRIALSAEFPRWAKAAALTFQMIYQQPVRHEFKLLKPPTLLVIGQQDRTVVLRKYASPEALKTLGQYPQLGQSAAKDIPNSKLVEIPSVGHIPHLEVGDKFNQSVLDFLRQ